MTVLTEAESARLVEALDVFYVAAKSQRHLYPTGYVELLAIALSCVDRGLSWGDDDLAIVKWTLERIFEQFTPEQYDEHLEGAYMRLWGVWPVLPPYFTKTMGLELPSDFPKLPPEEEV